MTKPRVFVEQETDAILAQMSLKLTDTVNADVVRPITLALERIKAVYAALVLLPEVPHLTIRTETLQTLLDYLELAIGENYTAVLREAGRSIGRSFASDFVKTLREIRSIPFDLSTLVKIWLTVESNARWGIFDVDTSKGTRITLNVEDFFLTRGLSKNHHRHCAFMEGYIESFLWESSKACSRWYKVEYGSLEKNRFPEPISVKDEPFGSACRFEILLKQEELSEAFDEFYKAKEVCNQCDYERVALSLRMALEIAFKEKIGIETTKQAPVVKIISALHETEQLAAPAYRTVKDVYGRTSAIIHGGVRSPAKEDCDRLVSDTGYVLKVLELLKLSDEQKKRILKFVEDKEIKSG